MDLQGKCLISFSLPENWGFMSLERLLRRSNELNHLRLLVECMAHRKYSINVTYFQLVMATDCIMDGGVTSEEFERLMGAKLWWVLNAMQNKLNLVLQSLGNSCKFWSTELTQQWPSGQWSNPMGILPIWYLALRISFLKLLT